MKLRLRLTLLVLGLCFNAFAQNNKTEILIVGSDHLNQIYKEDNPNTDVLTPKRQKEVEEFTSLILKYKPDMIMVEKLPEQQAETDSLFNLYSKGTLNFQNIENRRSEVFLLAFRIGKELQLPKVYCVDAPGGTSQSILDNGDNIGLYKNETLELRKIVGEKYAALQNGSLSLKDYLIFLNQPESYNKIYHLRYITPARITNGTFKNPDEMIDTAFVNPRYIGAELTSAFKNRDYKIYSNIVTNQMRQKPKRILLIIGVAHIGSLKNILSDDPEFAVIDANKYLKK
ncbi:DUF5694 domain-containing protein [Pontibacter chitinilyticus]|uniref:DUF5694 domain-containing protein n=1 Tax=Pontibacter chitinilyticus TaxID=2674989 RepID=UPI003218E74B